MYNISKMQDVIQNCKYLVCRIAQDLPAKHFCMFMPFTSLRLRYYRHVDLCYCRAYSKIIRIRGSNQGSPLCFFETQYQEGVSRLRFSSVITQNTLEYSSKQMLQQHKGRKGRRKKICFHRALCSSAVIALKVIF